MNKTTFRRYAWALVAYTVAVILWGAVVRATGSGAGCGSHWPLCNGEAMPSLERMDTTIELVHRITSTLAGVFVIGLVVFAYRVYGSRSTITRWAMTALAFIIIEGLLGRMLVVREWVAGNVSVMRAIVVAIHLANTYILLGTMTVTAWLSGKREMIRWRGVRVVTILIAAGILLSMAFSAMGAVTALGDTLFPKETLMTDFGQEFDPASHFLIRLRVIHPILAILTSGYLYFVVRYVQGKDFGHAVHRRGNILLSVIGVQVLAGGFTILTLAPLAMQVIHLLLADIFWISLLLFALEAFHLPVRKGEG
jgi:heme A synthase